MSIIGHAINQKIHDDMTQIQLDLEGVVKTILEQASDKIQPEIQEEFQRNIENTKQLLERFKSRYI